MSSTITLGRGASSQVLSIDLKTYFDIFSKNLPVEIISLIHRKCTEMFYNITRSERQLEKKVKIWA